MSWLSRLIGGGVGDTASAVGGLAKDLEDVFTTSDREEMARFAAETDRMKVLRADRAAQQEANIHQARHSSLFVAGARPALIWVGAIGMGYHFLFYPLIGPFLTEFTGVVLVDLDWQELSVLLVQLLGLSAYRSWEKYKGVARESMKD